MKYLEPSGTVQYAAELINVHPVPVITLNGTKVAIDTRVDTNVVNRIQVFYVGDSEVKDMINFNGLKEIGLKYDVYASGYKTFEGANMQYAKVAGTEGDYVVLVRYKDVYGATRYASVRLTYTAK